MKVTAILNQAHSLSLQSLVPVIPQEDLHGRHLIFEGLRYHSCAKKWEELAFAIHACTACNVCILCRGVYDIHGMACIVCKLLFIFCCIFLCVVFYIFLYVVLYVSYFILYFIYCILCVLFNVMYGLVL